MFQGRPAVSGKLQLPLSFIKRGSGKKTNYARGCQRNGKRVANRPGLWGRDEHKDFLTKVHINEKSGIRPLAQKVRGTVAEYQDDWVNLGKRVIAVRES